MKETEGRDTTVCGTIEDMKETEGRDTTVCGTIEDMKETEGRDTTVSRWYLAKLHYMWYNRRYERD